MFGPAVALTTRGEYYRTFVERQGKTCACNTQILNLELVEEI
jgi:hypothetical protein